MKRSDIDTIAGILADGLNAMKADMTARIDAVAAEQKASLEAYKEVQGAKVAAAVSDIKAALLEPSVAALTRLHAAEGRLAEIERTAREAKASIKDGEDAVVDHDLLLSELKAAMPEPVSVEPVSAQDVADILLASDKFADSIKGDKGDPGPAHPLVSIQNMVKAEVEDSLPDMIPDPIKGDAAEPVDYDSINKRIASVIENAVPEYVASVAHDLKGEPGESVTPEMVEDAVTFHIPSIREAIVADTKLFEVKGTYKDDETYEIGDVVMRSGSSYVKTKEGDFPPPSSSWQMMTQGKPGKKGGPGDKGDPGIRGIGIKSMSIEGTVLITIMDDDTVHELDLTETLVAMYTENGDDQ